MPKNATAKSLCLLAICLALARAADQRPATKDVSDEMHLINKSLEGLLSELALIKREATGRLSSVKNRVATSDQSERIRQTKVSRFVLKRVAELELESLGMRDEMARLFELQKKTIESANDITRPNVSAYFMANAESKQEDHDFDDLLQPQQQATSTSTATSNTQTTGQPDGMPATTALKPDDEATAIGFDLEALKKLGEEISKRLDQFGKEAAKNLSDLIEGVKLVFREPNKNRPQNNNSLAFI